jgi:hypothetical protein
MLQVGAKGKRDGEDGDNKRSVLENITLSNFASGDGSCQIFLATFQLPFLLSL